MEDQKAYDVKFKLKVVDVGKKNCIGAAAQELCVKQSFSNNIIFAKFTSLQIILAFLSSVLTQHFANKYIRYMYPYHLPPVATFVYT